MEQPPCLPPHHPISGKADDGFGPDDRSGRADGTNRYSFRDTLGALAERLGLDQSSLSRNLHGLERDGLVESAAVERDQRRRAVWLTEKGARRLEAAMPVWGLHMRHWQRSSNRNLPGDWRLPRKR